MTPHKIEKLIIIKKKPKEEKTNCKNKQINIKQNHNRTKIKTI